MFADEVLVARYLEQNREFFSSFAGAVSKAEGSLREPYLELGSSFAFFAGEGSPLTQAGGTFSHEDLERIMDFYRGRAKSWEAALTPFAGPEALQRLLDLGGKAESWENLMFQSLSEVLPDWEKPSEIEVVEVDRSNLSVWTEISTKVFFGEEPTDVSRSFALQMELTDNIRRYLALWEGQPAAAAVLTPSRGCGISALGGMATLPEYRRRGLQSALLRRRLEDARELGDTAVIGAKPGTSSHRNAERVGSKVAFTQLSLRVSV